MPRRPFPDIEGVRFRPISGFEGYAVSSDGRVWIGRNGPWRRMKPYTYCDGDEAVGLDSERGGFMKKLKELMALFDD